MHRAIFVVVVAGISVVPGVAHAGADPWKVVMTTDIRGQDQFGTITVASKRNGWAFGALGDYDVETPIAYHWNGKRWRRSALPKGLTVRNGYAGYDDSGLSASSDRNAWAVTATRSPVRALRWNGTKWLLSTVAKKGSLTGIAAYGKERAIAFGSNGKDKPTSWDFRGGRWREQPFKFKVEAVRSAGKYVWVLTVRKKQLVLSRWDGAKWLTVPTALSKPSGNAPITLTALGGNRVTVSAARGVESFLLTWNGKTWTRDTSPILKGWVMSRQVPDGKGGLWATAAWWDSSGLPSDESRFLWHRDARGAWTRTPLRHDDLGLMSFAHVPGTTTTWVAGSDPAHDWDTDGVIMKLVAK
jgi:hypothetical protein